MVTDINERTNFGSTYKETVIVSGTTFTSSQAGTDAATEEDASVFTKRSHISVTDSNTGTVRFEGSNIN